MIIFMTLDKNESNIRTKSKSKRKSKTTSKSTGMSKLKRKRASKNSNVFCGLRKSSQPCAGLPDNILLDVPSMKRRFWPV